MHRWLEKYILVEEFFEGDAEVLYMLIVMTVSALLVSAVQPSVSLGLIVGLGLCTRAFIVASWLGLRRKLNQ